MTDRELEKDLVELLLENPGLTARQLGTILDVYKGTINGHNQRTQDD